MATAKKFDFAAASLMISESERLTKMEGVTESLFSADCSSVLSGCSNLCFDGKNFKFQDRNSRVITILFDTYRDCCEILCSHLDSHCFYDKDVEWDEIVRDLRDPADKFSIRFRYFTLEDDSELLMGGKLVLDFAVGDSFNEKFIVHQFVHQNLHNGYYSHFLRFVLDDDEHIKELQFCV